MISSWFHHVAAILNLYLSATPVAPLYHVVSGMALEQPIERNRWIPALLFRWCGSTTADGGDDLIHVGKTMIMPLWMIMVTTLTWIDGWYMLIYDPWKWMEMVNLGNGGSSGFPIALLTLLVIYKGDPSPTYLKNSCWSNLFGASAICAGCDAYAAKRNLWSAIGIASFAFLCYLEFPEDVVNFWWKNKWIHGWMDVLPPWLNYGCLFSLKVPQILRENMFSHTKGPKKKGPKKIR